MALQLLRKSCVVVGSVVVGGRHVVSGLRNATRAYSYGYGFGSGRVGVVSSLQQLQPIHSFSRRWLHSTAIVSGEIFKMPDIGEGIYDVTIGKWYVQPGDEVKEFDKICEVSSDKATVEIKSISDGKIIKLFHGEMETAIVGKPLFEIEVTGGSGNGGDSGDASQSTTTTSPTAADGGDANAASNTSSIQQDGKMKFLMTPAVRRLVAENKIDLRRVVATGKDGRVLKEDILRFLDGSAVQSPTTATTTPTPTPTPTPVTKPSPSSSSTTTTTSTPTPAPVIQVASPSAQDKVVPIRGIQRAMVKSMTAALKVPTFGYSDEIALDNLIAVRDQLKGVAAKSNIKLTFMPFFIKAASLALTEFPILNAHVNDECTEITMRADHNISVAMDTPNGLLVPNIKAVQRLSVIEIAAELNRLQALGAAGRLGPTELGGGTFSLSNIGVVGGTYLSPVIVVPQVCIGALGRSSRLPRFDENDNVIAATIMAVSWSADHRVIDGMTMAKYSNRWKSYVEQPASMLLHLK